MSAFAKSGIGVVGFVIDGAGPNDKKIYFSPSVQEISKIPENLANNKNNKLIVMAESPKALQDFTTSNCQKV